MEGRRLVEGVSGVMGGWQVDNDQNINKSSIFVSVKYLYELITLLDG